MTLHNVIVIAGTRASNTANEVSEASFCSEATGKAIFCGTDGSYSPQIVQ